MIALLADMCEHSCTTGDGLVALAIAFGSIGVIWIIARWF